MRTPTALLVSSLFLISGLLQACDPGGDEAEATGSGDAAASAEAPLTQSRAEAAFPDTAAARVWTRMMDTLAPADGWPRTRYVQFDWIVAREDGELRRSHRWDLWEGDYRVEAPVNGGRMVALFNVNAPTEDERIWIDGEPVEDGARSDSLANSAHAMFVNDSYWLLMPYKWADDGVQAEHLGEMEQWGETYEVVELTFEDVGLTPQNKYRAFVDPSSGVMELWQHYRQADDPEPSFTMRWGDWQRYGPIMLSSTRPDQEGNSRIHFENLDASTEVPEGAFAPPADADAAPGATGADAGDSSNDTP